MFRGLGVQGFRGLGFRVHPSLHPLLLREADLVKEGLSLVVAKVPLRGVHIEPAALNDSTLNPINPKPFQA